jgi:retron-type reverse transcriptase
MSLLLATAKYVTNIIIIILSNLSKHRINPAQHGFRKFNSTSNNLVTYFTSITLKVKLILFIFDLHNLFDIVPHSILLNKLNNFRLSSSYVDWFLAIFIIYIPLYVFLVFCRSPLL